MTELGLALIVGYLLGSIPTGVWIARWAGVDIRHQGSRNTGATNVARTVGRAAGILTLLGDAAKGAAAILILRHFDLSDAAVSLGGVAAMIGHSYSIFLRLRGGKGVATALGVFVVLAPWAVAVSLVTFAAVVAITRYVSLASLVAAITLPIAVLARGYSFPICLSAVGAAALVLVRHRENLRRLANGTEPKFRSVSK